MNVVWSGTAEKCYVRVGPFTHNRRTGRGPCSEKTKYFIFKSTVGKRDSGFFFHCKRLLCDWHVSNE